MRRLLALAGILSLLFALAACGDDKKDAGTVEGRGLDAVTVSGDFGKAPDVKWNSQVEIDELDSKTLIEGTGDKVVKGDEAVVGLWIGNGFTKDVAFSSYTKDTPEAVKVDDTQLLKAIYAAVVDHSVGSRVEVVAPPEDTFGDQGNTSLGIDPHDNLVFLVDIMDKVLTKPAGAAQKPPADAPKLLLKDGAPTGFDFSKSPKTPSDKLQVITLIKGTGTKIAKGDTAQMDYLGQVYRAKKPFAQSYDTEPLAKPIGEQQLIKGWDQGLVGVPVGSRVLLVIPPDLGYGKAGQGEDIPGDSTLTFVVDVLAAY